MSEILPSNWERKPLISLADYINGYSFGPNDWSKEGRLIIRIEQLNNPKANGDRFNGEIPAIYNIEYGDLLFSWSATLKAKFWNGESGVLNQHLFKVIAKNKVDINLIQKLLEFYMDKLVAGSQGSAMKHITRKDLNKFQVALPIAIKEQQKIAKILSTVDNIIEQTQALIDKYTAIKQGMMADLFTRGIDLSGTTETNPNYGQLRPSVEEAPELYKETKLGWIPRDWEALSIEDVATKVTDGDHHTPLRSDEGVLLLSARNIHNGYLDLGNVDYVPLFEYDRMINRCHPEPGDILISCSGTIGRVCEVPKDIIFSLVRSVALIKLDLEKISSRYTEWFLKDEKSRKAMFDSSLQAAQPNLFQAAIKSLPLLLPELNEQREIAKRLDGFESLINLERVSMKQRKEIKKGLMQDLLTGKVRVNA